MGLKNPKGDTLIYLPFTLRRECIAYKHCTQHGTQDVVCVAKARCFSCLVWFAAYKSLPEFIVNCSKWSGEQRYLIFYRPPYYIRRQYPVDNNKNFTITERFLASWLVESSGYHGNEVMVAQFVFHFLYTVHSSLFVYKIVNNNISFNHQIINNILTLLTNQINNQSI